MRTRANSRSVRAWTTVHHRQMASMLEQLGPDQVETKTTPTATPASRRRAGQGGRRATAAASDSDSHRRRRTPGRAGRPGCRAKLGVAARRHLDAVDDTGVRAGERGPGGEVLVGQVRRRPRGRAIDRTSVVDGIHPSGCLGPSPLVRLTLQLFPSFWRPRRTPAACRRSAGWLPGALADRGGVDVRGGDDSLGDRARRVLERRCDLGPGSCPARISGLYVAPEETNLPPMSMNGIEPPALHVRRLVVGVEGLLVGGRRGVERLRTGR